MQKNEMVMINMSFSTLTKKFFEKIGFCFLKKVEKTPIFILVIFNFFSISFLWNIFFNFVLKKYEFVSIWFLKCIIIKGKIKTNPYFSGMKLKKKNISQGWNWTNLYFLGMKLKKKILQRWNWEKLDITKIKTSVSSKKFFGEFFNL